MQMQEITVQKVWNNAKGPCKVVDANGKEWKFWKPGKYGGIDPDLFQEGKSYKVSFEVKPYDGKDEFYIKMVDQGQSTPTPKVMHKPHSAEPRPPTNPKDGERMGTMGMVNGFISSGQVPLQRDAIKSTIKMCRDAYNDEWGSPQKQQTNGELGDSIDF